MHLRVVGIVGPQLFGPFHGQAGIAVPAAGGGVDLYEQQLGRERVEVALFLAGRKQLYAVLGVAAQEELGQDLHHAGKRVRVILVHAQAQVGVIELGIYLQGHAGVGNGLLAVEISLDPAVLQHGQARAQPVHAAQAQVGVGVAGMLVYPFIAHVDGLVGKLGVFLVQLGVGFVLEVFEVGPLGHGDAEMRERMLRKLRQRQVKVLLGLGEVHGVDRVQALF